MGRLRRRIEFLFRRGRFECDLEEEMQFHLEMLSGEEGGAAAARRRFGSAALAGEQSREAWGWGALERLTLDLRYALRTLRRSPGFTAVAVLTLALAIGANTAVFSVVNAIVFRPLPFDDPDRLVMLWETWKNQPDDRAPVSYYNFTAWEQNNRSFERLAGIAGARSNVTMGEEPLEVPGFSVTPDFFEVLGTRPAQGRLFQESEHRRGVRVVMLSHALWRRLGAADLIGKTISISRERYEVAGIMPRGFAFPDEAQLWYPMLRDRMSDPQNHDLRVIGRLKRGMSLAAARAEMNALAVRLRITPYTAGAAIGPLKDQVVGESPRRSLVVLLAAVACILLIACANVASLMLARATGRQREIALRLALGASRGRVVRGLLVESVLLALAGGLLGLAWAWWGVRAFVALDPLKLPRVYEVGVDGPLLLFTFGVTVLTGILFGLAPALRVSRPDLNEALKEGSERQAFAGPGRNRSLAALAVAQVAVAVVLMVAAGLLVRSFINRVTVPLGFNAERLVAVGLPWAAHKRVDEVLERLRAIPGVTEAAAATTFPHEPPGVYGSFWVEGDSREREAGKRVVTPGYFRAAGMAIRRGRATAGADNSTTASVAVVNEALARRYFGGRDPIGRKVRTTDGKVWRTVVGVVADAKGYGVDGDPMPAVYLPYGQDSWNNPVCVVLRTAVPPLSLAPAVRKEIRSVSPRWIVKIDEVETLMARTVAAPRFYAVLVAAFASLAFLLAAVGIYGTINYAVTQRTHEIGVRMALGAGRGELLRTIVGRALALVSLGGAMGLAGAWAATRVMESLLFQVHARDAIAFAAACVLLLAAGLLASYLPARRAIRIDPTAALRL